MRMAASAVSITPTNVEWVEHSTEVCISPLVEFGDRVIALPEASVCEVANSNRPSLKRLAGGCHEFSCDALRRALVCDGHCRVSDRWSHRRCRAGSDGEGKCEGHDRAAVLHADRHDQDFHLDPDRRSDDQVHLQQERRAELHCAVDRHAGQAGVQTHRDRQQGPHQRAGYGGRHGQPDQVLRDFGRWCGRLRAAAEVLRSDHARECR